MGELSGTTIVVEWRGEVEEDEDSSVGTAGGVGRRCYVLLKNCGGQRRE